MSRTAEMIGVKMFIYHSFAGRNINFFKAIIGTPNVRIVDVAIIKPVQLTKVLVSPSKERTPDMIFITGESTVAESYFANDAIEDVIVGRKALPTQLVNLMTDIEDKLEKITHYRPRCGIRNKMLFVNMSGIYCDKREYISDLLNMLVGAVHYIRKTENEHFSLSDDALSADSDLSEQEDEEDNFEAYSSDSSEKLFAKNVSENADYDYEGLVPNIIPVDKVAEIFQTIAFEDKKISSSELVKISDACGRILCTDVHSNCNVPPFRTSKKHGYAVLAKDGIGKRRVQEEGNRFPPIPLQPGTCLWVNSGAPIPEGATAVVHVEDTKPLEKFPNDDSKYIEIMIQPQHGQNIKTVGYDITKGVLSIGNNLQEPGASSKPGFVYDINRITLISLLKENGFSPLDLGIVNINLMSMREKIAKALKQADVLVITCFVNNKDYLKTILTVYFRATIYIDNINIKPGRSTTFASCKFNGEKKYFLCLSGNLTSALVAAHYFVLPFIQMLHLIEMPYPAIISVKVKDAFVLHHRPAVVLARLQWLKTEKFARVSSICKLHKDRLCNIIGSNAFLLLPFKEKEVNILHETNKILPAMLIDHYKDSSNHDALKES
ncbi:PREDICTED: gephyrin-like isoform X2 [Vollenhovia emeryi]|uniref:gephyrin-like isoform X2 n=1 Tax=Vollenhovia emeryi TaxID=411798 RepID=UPI0005F4093F|nr:PREDICTED: gephyrin-like isoform X2 [Vollenhovia emeryi]